MPRKHQLTADAVSRAPAEKLRQMYQQFVEELEAFAALTVLTLPATTQRMSEIRKAELDNEECGPIRTYCTQGRPTYVPHQPLLRPYWENKTHLTLTGDLLLYDKRMVIPRSVRLEILDHIHTGHLSITKCQARARTSVWWPGPSSQIENMVANCDTCARDRPETKEPLLSASFT